MAAELLSLKNATYFRRAHPTWRAIFSKIIETKILTKAELHKFAKHEGNISAETSLCLGKALLKLKISDTECFEDFGSLSYIKEDLIILGNFLKKCGGFRISL